jgi:hypothetical protein
MIKYIGAVHFHASILRKKIQDNLFSNVISFKIIYNLNLKIMQNIFSAKNSS